MANPKLTKAEFLIMEFLWLNGTSSIREILEMHPGRRRPAYTTVQTTVYRMEAKGLVRRCKVGSAHLFTAALSRTAAERRLIDDLLALLKGRSQHVMARLVEKGDLTPADVKDARRLIKRLTIREKP